MKIIFVCGILSPPRQGWSWRKQLEKHFSGATVVAPHKFYYCTLTPQIRSYINLVRQEIKSTDEDTLILAHSFGGLVAKKALETVKRKNIKLVTMATPHGRTWLTRWGECEAAKGRLVIPHDCPYLEKTYAGAYDAVVHLSIAQIDGTQNLTLRCLHMSFMLDPNIRKRVIEETLKPLVSDFSA